MATKGKFLVIDGPDGTGKTTQAKLLEGYQKSKGFEVVLTNEPSNGKIGSLLKHQYLKDNFPLIDAFLFAADREDHLKGLIIPALEQGKIVISDRYYYAALVYQNVQGLKLEWLLELNKFFPKPDLSVFLLIDPELCIKRIESDAQHTGVEKFEQLDFLKKTREKFLELKEKLKDENIVIVDGNGSRENVHEKIVEIIEKNI